MSLADRLVHELKLFFAAHDQSRGVVGISGGVDSAVVAALAVRALGEKNVTGLILPQAGLSSPVSAELATELAKKFGIATRTVEIGDAVDVLKKALPWPGESVADANLAPRVRMTVLYHFARAHRALVLGTSNKSECLLGYGTKWGDFAADVEVIGNCWKHDVYALAKELGVPVGIIARPPTAELFTGHTDAAELGATYDILDPMLAALEKNGFTLPEGADALTEKTLARVLMNAHKTRPIPLLPIA